MEILERLKANLREADYPFFTDEALEQLLEQANGDVDEASRLGCLIKAECDGIQLADLSLESSRSYWLSLSRLYRKDRTGGVTRRDDA